MDTEKLIHLVEEKHFIYDKSRSDFKNNMKKYYAWQEIASELGVTVTDAQKKWKLLREKYGKEKRIRQRSRDGGESSRGEWEYYRLLKFLDPHIIGRRSASSFEPPSQFPLICQSQMSDSRGSLEYSRVDLGGNEQHVEQKEIVPFSHSFVSTPSSCSTKLEAKSRAITASPLQIPDSNERVIKSSVEESYINSIHSLHNEKTIFVPKDCHASDDNDDTHFGKDIISELRKMKNVKKKRQLKAKIYALICEYDSD